MTEQFEESDEQRRHPFSPAESVADLCDERDITPAFFYSWSKTLVKDSHLAFGNGREWEAVGDARKEDRTARSEGAAQKRGHVDLGFIPVHAKAIHW